MSKMNRPGKTGGLRHVALFVESFEATEAFYKDLLGMTVEWRPDEDNVYLTSGNDNLALHRVSKQPVQGQLDHIGFFINEIGEVDVWCEFLEASQVEILSRPKTHRDGARSFYCKDPAGTSVQMIYHPLIAQSDTQTQ